MSIFRSKFVMFLLALFCIIPFSFALVGCGEPAGMNSQQARTAANTQIKQAVQNSTMDITAAYSYGTTQESTRMKIQMANGNIHSQEFNAQGAVVDESWSFNGYQYSYTTMTSSSVNGEIVEQLLRATTDRVDMSSLFETFASSEEDVLAQYVAIASKFTDNPVKVEVVNGATTLIIGADVSQALNKLLNNLTTNYKKPLAVFINQIIDDVLGQEPLAENEEPAESRVTISKLLKGFTDNLTAETTVGDVVELIETSIGTSNISKTLEVVMKQGGMSWEDISETPILSTLQLAVSFVPDLPFADAIKDGEGNITGESLYNGLNGFLESDESSIDSLVTFVMNKIQESIASISSGINSSPLTGPDDPQPAAATSLLDQYIPMIAAINVTKAEFTVKIIFDTNNKLTGMKLIAAGAVAMGEETTMGANATIDIAFSNIGTTQVAAPSDDVRHLDLELTVNLDDVLNAGQDAYVITLPTIAFAEDVTIVDNVDNTLVLAQYNKATNQLTINKAWVDAEIENDGEISIRKFNFETRNDFAVIITPQAQQSTSVAQA